MKFRKTHEPLLYLSNNDSLAHIETPEWRYLRVTPYNANKSAYYLNYNALKRQIRLVQKPWQLEAPNDRQSPDLTGMELHYFV